MIVSRMLRDAAARQRADAESAAFVELLLGVLDIPEVADAVRARLHPAPPAAPARRQPPSGRGRR